MQFVTPEFYIFQSHWLWPLNDHLHQTSTDRNSCDDVEMLEAANKILSSTWSDIICSAVQSRIELSVMANARMKKIVDLYSSVKFKDIDHEVTTSGSTRNKPLDASSRLTEMCNTMKSTNYLRVRSITEARIISDHLKWAIIILDVDGKTISQINPPEKHERCIELIYNLPCSTYPMGHYDAYSKDGSVFMDEDNRYNKTGHYDVHSDYWDDKFVEKREKKEYRENKNIKDDPSLLLLTLDRYYHCHSYHQRTKVSLGTIIDRYIRKHPRRCAELLACEHYACQLKRERALLKLDTNPPKRQMDQWEYSEFDSSHLSSCIEQALMSENVSQLAKVLAEFESESRAAQVASPETEFMTSHVSRDACKIFMTSGRSFEAGVYRQPRRGKNHGDDIATTLKLCCIGHQIPFCRYNSNQPDSDAQTVRDTFKQMLKVESYEQERSLFLSICEEWYRVLEPRGLMNKEQRELLREWISTRKYANTEDPIVSQVLGKLSNVEVKKKKRRKKKVETKEPRSENGRKKKNNTKTQLETV